MSLQEVSAELALWKIVATSGSSFARNTQYWRAVNAVQAAYPMANFFNCRRAVEKCAVW